MRILYAINSAGVGGAENHVWQLVAGFARDNSVIIVCPQGEMVDKFRQAGAEVILDQPRFEIDPFFIFRMFTLLRRRQIEIVHAHELMAASNLTLAAFLARTPVRIIHIHSPISGWRVPIYKKILDLIANFFLVNLLATKAIALMESIKKERVHGEGILPSKIVVIPNGIDIKNFSKQDGEKAYRSKLLTEIGVAEPILLVGTLSRLTEEKGIDVFLESVSSLQKSDPGLFKRCHFLVAGEGHWRERLEKAVEDSHLTAKVTFLGFVAEGNISLYLQALNLFVFPTLHEGFGLVLAEAMVSETLTLSSDLSVLRELTGEGTFGFHFKVGDPSELACQMALILNKEGNSDERLGKARAHICENFSQERFIERYQELYQDLLMEKNR